MNDLISKKEAIKIFLDEGMPTAAVYIERMKPAQPFVKCSDCKFGIPCGKQIMCELMEYIHFERNDFCSQGVAK